jgi:hypothetical protein
MNRSAEKSKGGGNLVQWIAVAILAGSMFSASRRAILPMLMGVARFMMPFIIIWIVYKLIKSKVNRFIRKFQEQMMQGAHNGSAPEGPAGFAHMGQSRKGNGGGGEVLDLCPKCGSLLSGSHRCS